MIPIRKANQPVNKGFFAIIERYWLVILGLILLIPVLFRYLKDSNTKSEVNEVEEQIKLNNVVNLSPVTQLEALSKIEPNQAYHNWARSIAHHLGTLYLNQGNWYDFANPKSMTENDQEAYKLLAQITNTGQKKILSELYFTLTARNLSTDVTSLLDKEFLIKLKLFR
ncbi:hypothetical protein [Flavobacterium franklandianum]|uniref:Uncharacterized protein n=1 Tax=Flavobacterium franklandianum TaxID=2594430 RepID=A0A553C8A3_9FLAO|nr:hypothetical protein [Flavobacterium franklandianum]TRX16737.1 hypothetical protein FNW17_12305 [Flavobacterium franklandianum]